MIFAVFSFVGLLAFSGTAYAQKQIIQKVATTNSTTTSSASPNADNITLGNPAFTYTEHGKITRFKPAIINGTNVIRESFTGHGILNGTKIINNGSTYVTNTTAGRTFAWGDGKLVSASGGTLKYGIQAWGQYGADGKLREVGQIFADFYSDLASGVSLKSNQGDRATGDLAFLNLPYPLLTTFKYETDKAGNYVGKVWFWR